MPPELRRLREAAKWRQEDLAKHSKIDQGTISRLERGLWRRGPTHQTLTALARTLNSRFRRLHLRQRVRPDELLAEHEHAD